jgi:hypothetical protein
MMAASPSETKAAGPRQEIPPLKFKVILQVPMTVFDERGTFCGTLLRNARGVRAYDRNNQELGSFANADEGARAIWRSAHAQQPKEVQP